MFFFSYIGTLPLFEGLVSYEVEAGVIEKELILKILIFSSISISCFILGAIFSFISLISIKNKKVKVTKVQRKVSNSAVKKEKIFLLLGFCVVMLFLYISKIDQVALFVLVKNGVLAAELARSEMGNNFTGSYHWYDVFIHHVPNLISYVLFASYLQTRCKPTLKLFLVTFIFCSFTALMSIEKSPFAFYLIGLFIVFMIVKNTGNISASSVVALIVTIMSLLLLTFYFFAGIDELSKTIVSVINRTFASSISPAYHYLDIFPKHRDFLYGLSFPNPGGLFPFEPYRLTVEVAAYLSPHLYDLGIVGSMPAVFWTEAYANFGLIGILFISFLFGYALGLVDFIFMQDLDNPVKIGMFVSLIMHYKNLSMTGFSGFLIDPYAAMLFCSYFFLRSRT
jgi:oligosaccharide repeat unit polymerase